MKKSYISALMVLAAAQPAFAEEKFNNYEAGMWMIRARAIGVMPDESSSITPIGGRADFDNTVVPELDFTYFFTKNIAVEAILGITKHNATAEGTLVGDVDAGSAWVLPPTVTLQYHFTNFDSFKPYVGAGINYTMYLMKMVARRANSRSMMHSVLRYKPVSIFRSMSIGA